MSNQTASGIQICDRDCDKAAVFAYVWEWGESGVCCAEHAAVLQQTASNLGRSVTLTSLNQAPAPLERPERTRLIAEKLAAEAELEEVKKAGADLYNDNHKLTLQVQSLTTRKNSLELLVKESDRKAAESDARCQELEAVNADQLQELERLRRLLKFASPQEQPAVVDGPPPAASVVGGPPRPPTAPAAPSVDG
jgi:hypothetical protein